MKLHHRIARHVLAASMAFRVWYPAHEARAESATYRASRKALIEDDPDACCRVCGSKHNLETHHFYVEWAFANAVDWDKMRELHPSFDWASFKEPEDFVDSVYNLSPGVLCRKHHRLHAFGIHNLPYPVWLEQRHKPDDWRFAAREKS